MASRVNGTAVVCAPSRAAEQNSNERSKRRRRNICAREPSKDADFTRLRPFV
jgi:hypothetical protein